MTRRLTKTKMQRAGKTTEEDWLNVARETLIKEGFAAIKVDRLAQKLGVTRGGFYWRFSSRDDLLKALLADWRKRTTGPMLAALNMDGTPLERYKAFQHLCIVERDYSPVLDSAVRAWAQSSRKVARIVHAEDDVRIAALQDVFEAAGSEEYEAFIRARVTYFHQVGYYALNVKESRQRRLDLADMYRFVLTGFDEKAMARKADSATSRRSRPKVA